MSRILFVVTGASGWTLNDGSLHPTGDWAEELFTPYRAVTEAGHTVDFATPGGVTPVADPASLPEPNGEAMSAVPALRQPLDLADVDVSAYDAVFYPGGHGPMEDLVADPASGRLLAESVAADRPVGLVCHGVAALLAATDSSGGLAAAGRRVTSFSDAEEREAGLADRAPFLVESRLRERGVEVDVAGPWQDHVVVDGKLVTGQNPQSSESVARALLDALG